MWRKGRIIKAIDGLKKIERKAIHHNSNSSCDNNSFSSVCLSLVYEINITKKENIRICIKFLEARC